MPRATRAGRPRLGPAVDSGLARWAARRSGESGRSATLPTCLVPTRAGRVRVHDTGHDTSVGTRDGTGHDDSCVVIVPDGPNVIEHYTEVIASLAVRRRVVCFDLPGFGFSVPGRRYDHSLDAGARAVLDVLDALDVSSATLSFSCANGFYALRVARIAPERVSRLVLSQTPSLVAMQEWVGRTVPRVIRVPVVGQVSGWILRHRAAAGWYRAALPSGADVEGFRRPAMLALNHGACFSLAGVVQGLGREEWSSLFGVDVPCTLIWGTGDRSHSRTDPATLLEAASHAEIVRFESGHFPDLEQPERFVAIAGGAATPGLV